MPIAVESIKIAGRGVSLPVPQFRRKKGLTVRQTNLRLRYSSRKTSRKMEMITIDTDQVGNNWYKSM
jgi:hypothetical protein